MLQVHVSFVPNSIVSRQLIFGLLPHSSLAKLGTTVLTASNCQHAHEASSNSPSKVRTHHHQQRRLRHRPDRPQIPRHGPARLPRRTAHQPHGSQAFRASFFTFPSVQSLANASADMTHVRYGLRKSPAPRMLFSMHQQLTRRTAALDCLLELRVVFKPARSSCARSAVIHASRRSATPSNPSSSAHVRSTPLFAHTARRAPAPRKSPSSYVIVYSPRLPQPDADDEQRHDAERILTQEAGRRRALDNRILALMQVPSLPPPPSSLEPPVNTTPTRPRANTMLAPMAWWTAAKSRLAMNSGWCALTPSPRNWNASRGWSSGAWGTSARWRSAWGTLRRGPSARWRGAWGTLRRGSSSAKGSGVEYVC
ncbi:hypothetical protein BJ138DRAFT_1116675 [Hygrophoropsis aurantiaca]|uniref:Uncharacterized protein n=1 Tax=Hygrophoropsis aurantiaca TaxID=72124 RepID=A0ACB8A3Y4_9AGAM|nr:hypothetical protein BJ138DRAFT_1116675 [Hygrophoropsis aurantiaca]